ncbi:hypothetical protein ElyMa_004206300 [Elysia marginata]|uniref:Uncharacterized protein n=1 Tax=Elysia marginata TaxID=1093978 RepID=A0AAV4GN42_9GAST|nr:hypothetical protein ElyMa_004206300 [Elysia marginata]
MDTSRPLTRANSPVRGRQRRLSVKRDYQTVVITVPRMNKLEPPHVRMQQVFEQTVMISNPTCTQSRQTVEGQTDRGRVQ